MAAYAMAKKEKTAAEWKSEAEKWEEQTRIAQQIVLDTALALSQASRESARLAEEARLTKLKTDAEISRLTADLEKHKKELPIARGERDGFAELNARLTTEVAELKAEIARLKAPPAAPEPGL